MFRIGKSIPIVATLIVVFGCAASNSFASVGVVVDNFRLQDFRGAAHALSHYSDKKAVAVVFLGTECPLAKLYGPRLQRLAQEYGDRGVAILGVDSNVQDSLAEIEAYVRRHEIEFPVLKDPGNKVADAFGAERTPEVFLLDAKRRVRYHGRIDDQYGVGYARKAPTRDDLRIAIDELLAGKPISQPITEAVGCYIGCVSRPDADCDVTYSDQIARIFQKHCVECHRPGEIAPFSLTEYDEVAGWAETILEVIEDKRMPPWHAENKGKFANERLMSDGEKKLVQSWVEAGAPEGDPSNLPEPRTFVSGWRLPQQPDVVLPMRQRPYQVAAEGTIEYQYFVVDPQFTEDKWVTAAEVVPGNREVVHHAIVFVRPPDDDTVAGIGWLAAFVPGQGTVVLDEGQARRVPAGSKLVFQMHYTPNGSPQEDITRIGLVFADREKVKEEVVSLIALNRDFEIPPRAANYRVETTIDDFPKNGRLMGLAPHMHLRGKSFRFILHRDGESEYLLDVPRYDFNWQHGYWLNEPIKLTDGTKIECVAHFDNTEENLANPNPDARVRWGDQSWQEMMLGYFEVAFPVTMSKQKKSSLNEAELAKARRTATAFMKRFDKDGDGRVKRDETPDAFAMFGFKRFDRNSSRDITLQEAIQAAKESIKRER